MRGDASNILLSMGYRLDVDFVAVDDGLNACVIQWLSQQPQPTEVEIDAAALPAAKARYRALVRSTAIARVTAKYGEDDVMSLVAGAYTSDSATEAQQWIGAMRAKVKTTVAQINAATSEAQLDAGWAALTWPAAPAGDLIHDEQSFSDRMAEALALRQAATQAITDLTTLANTSGTLTGAQLSGYLRGLAVILRDVVRHVRRLT